MSCAPRVSSWISAVTAGALIASSSPGPASAQPAATTAASEARKHRQAKALVDAGLAAHDRGDYDQAIALYEQAYALVPHPALYFDIGQSHRLAGRPAQAIAMYRRYLAEVSAGPLADQARAWIATLEPHDAVAADPSRAAAPSLTATAPAPVPRAPRPDAGRPLRLAGYGTAAAGLIAIGAGALYGLRARRLSDQLSQPGAPFEPDTFDAGRTAERRMIVCYGAGGVLVATGVVLLLLGRDRSDREADAPSIAPVIGGGEVGVSWTGSF